MFIPRFVGAPFDYDAASKIKRWQNDLRWCNKANCYVALEYKYTGGNAMEWRSVPFHEVALNLAAGSSG